MRFGQKFKLKHRKQSDSKLTWPCWICMQCDACVGAVLVLKKGSIGWCSFSIIKKEFYVLCNIHLNKSRKAVYLYFYLMQMYARRTVLYLRKWEIGGEKKTNVFYEFIKNCPFYLDFECLIFICSIYTSFFLL